MNRIKKKRMEMDAAACPTQQLARHISHVAQRKQKSKPQKVLPCEWNRREEYTTITKAYEFDSGLREKGRCQSVSPTGIHAASASVPASTPVVIPVPRQRLSQDSTQPSQGVPTKGTSELKNTLRASRALLNPIFRRKSSSSSLNDVATAATAATVPSLTHSSTHTQSTYAGNMQVTQPPGVPATPVHRLPIPEKQHHSNRSTSSLLSATSNASSYPEYHYTVVVENDLSF